MPATKQAWQLNSKKALARGNASESAEPASDPSSHPATQPIAVQPSEATPSLLDSCRAPLMDYDDRDNQAEEIAQEDPSRPVAVQKKPAGKVSAAAGSVTGLADSPAADHLDRKSKAEANAKGKGKPAAVRKKPAGKGYAAAPAADPAAADAQNSEMLAGDSHDRNSMPEAKAQAKGKTKAKAVAKAQATAKAKATPKAKMTTPASPSTRTSVVKAKAKAKAPSKAKAKAEAAGAVEAHNADASAPEALSGDEGLPAKKPRTGESATFASRRRNDANPTLARQFDVIRSEFAKLDLPYCEQDPYYKHMRAGWTPDVSAADAQKLAESYVPAKGSAGVTRRMRRSNAMEDLTAVESRAAVDNPAAVEDPAAVEHLEDMVGNPENASMETEAAEVPGHPEISDTATEDGGQ